MEVVPVFLGADVKDTFFKQWKFTVMKGAWGYYCQTYPTWSRSGEVEANFERSCHGILFALNGVVVVFVRYA